MRPARLKKNFLSPPHLKIWIRHCLPTCLPTCSSTPWPAYMLTYMGTGVFTIYTNQLGGNLLHYRKVYEIWCGGRSTGYTVYQNQLNRPKRVEKLHHLTNHGPYFLKLPIQNGPNHLIFELLFSVFYVNGKCPLPCVPTNLPAYFFTCPPNDPPICLPFNS